MVSKRVCTFTDNKITQLARLYGVKFEVFIVVKVQVMVFWVMTLCNVVVGCISSGK